MPDVQDRQTALPLRVSSEAQVLRWLAPSIIAATRSIWRWVPGAPELALTAELTMHGRALTGSVSVYDRGR